jgi:serine/threonine-protein kinase
MLEAGQTLSHYRILDKLGAGGMGVVYRAEDTKLGRQVAIKLLPDAFARDPERLARFEREARLLASLNHPNIAAIHGLEEAEGKCFLVLELVEGQTLEHQIAVGADPRVRPPGGVHRGAPLQIDTTLDIGRQIAAGLEAAHEKGIIHRDLKPANVKITPEGKVKILDFGLAKVFHEEPAAADLSQSPTVTEQMSRPGVILGTAAYMSPEQARGKPLDKRTDIWAFGCVLYECLTGKRAFQGDTITEALAAILKSEPDWTVLPTETPLSVRAVLRQCLQKDPNLRLHDIADARIELQDSTLRASEIQPAVAPAPIRWRLLPWIVALVMLLIAVASILRSWRPPEKAQLPTRRFVISLPEPLNRTVTYQNFAFSLDGMHLAYVGGYPNTLIYHRRLNELEFKPIAGTEGGNNPFFSPDGKWVGFFADGRLKKVPVAGGPVVMLTDNVGSWPAGGIWETDDSILFQLAWSSGIARTNASASGAASETLFAPDRKQNERGLLWPQRLPANDLVLFTAYSGNIASSNDSRIAIARLGDRSKRTILTGGTYGRYLSTGHLIYGYDGKLMAAPLDLEKLKLDGSAVPVLEGILMNPYSGATHFGVSNTGDLVYVPGSMIKGRDSLVLVDRNGKQQLIDLPRGENESHSIQDPNVSPDGSRIAIHMLKTNDDIHVYDFSSGTLTRFTFEDGDERSPVWAPDGTKMAYMSEPGPICQMFLKSVSGNISPEPIFGGEYPRYPFSFSPDGKTLAFVENHPKTGWDIWTGPIKGEGQPKPFLQTGHSESCPAFSPDGKWMAYQSDKSGRMQVYVTSFPDGRAEKQISLDGGAEPRWGPSGKELFYLNGNRFMFVETSLQPTFSAAKPLILFTIDPSVYRVEGMPNTSYAIIPDGKRFVFIKQTPVSPVTQVILVENWFEELKRLVPTGKK